METFLYAGVLSTCVLMWILAASSIDSPVRFRDHFRDLLRVREIPKWANEAIDDQGRIEAEPEIPPPGSSEFLAYAKTGCGCLGILLLISSPLAFWLLPVMRWPILTSIALYAGFEIGRRFRAGDTVRWIVRRRWISWCEYHGKSFEYVMSRGETEGTER